MPTTPYLRPLLGHDKPIWAMGAHDVLSAKIVERAGYDAVGVQSLQVAFANGVPDIGLISPDELVRVCRAIRRAVSLPIVVDFEQGFGEPFAAVYWMKELQAAGVAALHIDDYGLPFKCPFIPPHVMGLESIEDTSAKIRAMVGEKHDDEFMVIARPGTFVANRNASEPEKFADWLARAHAYTKAGADALFAVGWNKEQMRFFAKNSTLPVMTIRTLGTRIDAERVQYDDEYMNMSIDELYELGYEMYIEPTTLLGVAANAMLDAAVRVRQTGRSAAVAAEHGSLYDHLESWMSVAEVRRIRSTYLGESYDVPRANISAAGSVSTDD